MEELIKKSDFITDIKNTMPQGTSRGVFLALIDDAPTTTDAEIRNRAIDEFAKALLTNEVVDKSVVRRVAEQLKEE